MPGPSLGINAVDGLGEMSPLDAIYAFNLQPTEYGLRLRRGYREWSTAMSGEVRTVIPFEGSAEDGSFDRIFVATENGIYDATLDGSTAEDLEIAFTFPTGRAGYGVYVTHTAADGSLTMMYADEVNGLFDYNEVTGIWKQAPDPTGTPTPPAAQDIVFIMSHKTRLWFVARDSSSLWYFAPDANTGDATEFTLSGKYKHGGYTVGLWNWTRDGGDGLDDLLVVLSRAGDIIVYQGTDPESVGAWDQKGQWFIGEVPNSRRLASEYGGELFILGAVGVFSMHDLVTNNRDYQQSAPSYRISRLVREYIQLYKEEPEWALKQSPSDNFLMIVLPKLAADPDIQFVMDLTRRSWGTWRGVPATSADTWRGKYYIGDSGRLLISDGTTDNQTIAGDLGNPIEFSLLTSYQTLNEPSVYKRVQFIRAKGELAGAASIVTRPIYDFDIDPSVDAPNPVSVKAEDTWDVGVWDDAIWSGLRSGAQVARGGRNMGIHVAVAMRGDSSDRLTFIGWDVMWDTGGLL
jgi:hypothetical protein